MFKFTQTCSAVIYSHACCSEQFQSGFFFSGSSRFLSSRTARMEAGVKERCYGYRDAMRSCQSESYLLKHGRIKGNRGGLQQENTTGGLSKYTQTDSSICGFHAINLCSFPRFESEDKTGLSLQFFSSPREELNTSCWGSCDKRLSCRFNSSGVSNTCHFLFSLQLSRCWAPRAEMRCAIKANLSLYSPVNPAMFNQPRPLRAPGRRDESRGASIHTQSEGRRSSGAVNSIWKSERGAHHGPPFDSWHLKV